MSTIPSLALVPSGYKASKVYSVLPNDGSGDFTFTRSGNATRVNKDGLIELVSSNVPRLNYPLIDGVVQGCPSLLLEPQRINLITNYTGSSFTAFNGASITSNNDISPDGSTNATLITTTGGASQLIQQSGISISSGQLYAISGYFKLKSGTLSNSNNAFKGLDGLNSVGVSGSTFNNLLSNEWKRLSFTVTSSTTSGRVQIRCDDNAEILVWGLQLEAGDYTTTIIPTTTGAATRSAETCNNAGNVNTFNDSEGVLFAEISALVNDLTFRQMSINGGTTNTVRLLYSNVTNQIKGFIQVGGSIVADISFTLSDIKINSKIALKYKLNDFALWVNGIKVGTDLLGSVFTNGTLNSFDFNDNGSGANPFYGNVKQIKYFNTALTDTELQQLTTL